MEHLTCSHPRQEHILFFLANRNVLDLFAWLIAFGVIRCITGFASCCNVFLLVSILHHFSFPLIVSGCVISLCWVRRHLHLNQTHDPGDIITENNLSTLLLCIKLKKSSQICDCHMAVHCVLTAEQHNSQSPPGWSTTPNSELMALFMTRMPCFTC